MPFREINKSEAAQFSSSARRLIVILRITLRNAARIIAKIKELKVEDVEQTLIEQASDEFDQLEAIEGGARFVNTAIEDMASTTFLQSKPFSTKDYEEEKEGLPHLELPGVDIGENDQESTEETPGKHQEHNQESSE